MSKVLFQIKKDHFESFWTFLLCKLDLNLECLVYFIDKIALFKKLYLLKQDLFYSTIFKMIYLIISQILFNSIYYLIMNSYL